MTIYTTEHAHSSLSILLLEPGVVAVRVGIALITLDEGEVGDLVDALTEWLAQQKGGEP